MPGRLDGVQLITFDRPGYGDSDPVANRTVRDTAPDVRALLDHLDVPRARLVAWSGGCPFAAATAFELGTERVEALTLVSGPGPLDEVPGGWDALADYYRPTAAMARVDADRATRAIVRHMRPFIDDPKTILGGGRGPDGDVMSDPDARGMLEAQVAAAVRQGAAGIATDLIAMWLPWGFTLADIAVPTAVFHGARDRTNAADARTYAERIPGASLRVWDDAGHLGILAAWSEVVRAP
jgi:pimeloyl-ACP methyl ester carboxylesterase